MDAQLKKGALKLCVLRCIAGEPCYGYSIMQKLHALFPEVDESTIYAILRRIYADGDAAISTGGVSGGPARKYYKTTPQGDAALAALEEEWTELVRRVASL